MQTVSVSIFPENILSQWFSASHHDAIYLCFKLLLIRKLQVIRVQQLRIGLVRFVQVVQQHFLVVTDEVE